jgi:hypothetical protein
MYLKRAMEIIFEYLLSRQLDQAKKSKEIEREQQGKSFLGRVSRIFGEKRQKGIDQELRHVAFENAMRETLLLLGLRRPDQNWRIPTHTESKL